MSLPTFQYNPNPVALNVISKEVATCPVCKQESEKVIFYSNMFNTDTMQIDDSVICFKKMVHAPKQIQKGD
ncbi:CbrC family protein [Bacillus velezensis]|uniref:CbrC family protein n=1 Tax=Bacillus velezensis TaxID=492670 RepID=UPI000B4D5D78|nr:CbrC family protein [Bacillus velezensis]OWP59504.1 hypothetical protein CEA92_09505 [Bacillus velezensis]QEQ06053.1 CbrC family protein [Bacillus velezensis]